MITLTTDFGLGSHYVAQMKGVILGQHPQATIIDLSHAIRPQAIWEAAWVLRESRSAFPAGTIHVAVVDPGVGSDRKILAVEFQTASYVLPDNGLLSCILEEETPRRIIQLTRPDFWRRGGVSPTGAAIEGAVAISHTFHGRDIMAPVAAHLDLGVPVELLGEPAEDLVRWPVPQVRRTPGELRGEIVYCDPFGNAVTNLSTTDLRAACQATEIQLYVGDLCLDRLVSHYAAAPHGQTVALIGSGGYLEIAVVNGNAAHTHRLQPGQPIRVTWEAQAASLPLR